MAAPGPSYSAFLSFLPAGEARLRDKVWDALFPTGTVSLRSPADFEFRVSFLVPF